MSFTEIFSSYVWSDIEKAVGCATEEDVARVLANGGAKSVEDFLMLVSRAARESLPQMLALSQARTIRRFGRTIQLFAPLYVSNECQNICTYCGFSLHNKIPRKTLSKKELFEEVRYLATQGFRHILLVSGEAQKIVDVQYFREAIKTARPLFSQISIEVQPLETVEYAQLRDHGLHGVLVYQETYHKDRYRIHHPRGKKSNFLYRLQTPERIGFAGIQKIGLGVLLGLEDWRVDAFYCALHLEYLRKKFWKSRFSISFPRLRPAEGVNDAEGIPDEYDLLQLVTAFRLFDENVELSLSTRESESFRNASVGAGFTSYSAGSRTSPGGYTLGESSLQQFSTSDERSASAVALAIKTAGYEPVWKDWERVYDGGGYCAAS